MKKQIFNSIIRFTKTICIYIMCLLSHFSFAQNPLIQVWDHDIGGTSDEWLSRIEETNDHGYILGGPSLSGVSGDKSQPSWGMRDYWIVKTDAIGNLLWDKRFGGWDEDFLSSIHQTTDKGYILGGWSFSNIGGDKTQSGRGNSDYWIVKTDSLGNLEWEKRFGGENADELHSVQQTPDGGYILGGWSYSDISGDKTQPSQGSADYWMVKTDANGNLLWDKNFGGTGYDALSSLEVTADKGFIIGGSSDSGIGGDKTESSRGINDYWILKADSLGNKQWDKRFGGSNFDFLISIQQTSDKGFILGGFSESGVGGDKTQPSWGLYDYWVVKTDSFGIKLWDKRYGGTNDEDEFGNICQTLEGGYLIAGTSYSSVNGDKTEPNLGLEQSWIVLTDSLGNKLWDKTLFTSGHDEQGLAIQTSDGCYTFANYTKGDSAGYKTQESWGGYDFWITKFCDSFLIPQSSFVSDTISGCLGSCFEFINNSLNATSYQWLFPGANPASSSDPQPAGICYNNSGIYDVTLIASNNFFSDTVVQTGYITIFNLVSISVYQNGNLLSCNAAAISYQWYFNGSLISNETSQTITINQTGTYTVNVTDTNGCSATADIIVSEIPSSGISVSDTAGCQNFCVNFFDESTKDPSNWQWIFPGAAPSSSPDQDPENICYENPGVYDVTLITTNALGIDTIKFQNFITVFPTPPVPTITQDGAILTCSPALSYQWQKNYFDIPAATNQSYSMLQSGYYSVIITGEMGCTASSTIYALISGIPEVDSDNNLVIYPNPSEGNFIVRLSNSDMEDIATITVYNTLGRIIFTSEKQLSTTGEILIDLYYQPNGVYLIKAHSGRHSLSQKLIINK